MNILEIFINETSDRIYIYQFHVDTNQLESIEKIYKEALHL